MSTAAPSPAERPDSAAAAAPSPVPGAPPDSAAPAPPAPARPESDDSFHDPAVAHLPELKKSDLQSRPEQSTAATKTNERPPRSLLFPLVLFLATCASTFWVGVTHWEPMRYADNWHVVGQVIAENWRNGLVYMTAVLSILLVHEMGHFVQTVRYHIPASYPLFIPLPISQIGTMGAVIGMDGMRADRKQIFDIGIAGPLAGLVVALPVLWLGIDRLDLARPTSPGEIEFNLPLVAQWMLQWTHPAAPWAGEKWVSLSELNPFFMAGWVGMLITGLNMLPISQLDGGHTIYALFLDGANAFAKRFLVLAIAYVVLYLDEAVLWAPMLILVILLGILHPKTADDRVPLGPVRWAIGLASLAIPVLCFPLLGVRQ